MEKSLCGGAFQASGELVARLPVGKIDRREKAWNGMSEQSTTCQRVDGADVETRLTYWRVIAAMV
jgi:hypothetical protein